jgi:hypothetical protein
MNLSRIKMKNSSTGCQASAQTDASQLLVDGFKGALLGLKPIPEKEKQAVLRCVAATLMSRMTFRKDGVATSVHELSGRRTHIEWKELKVSHLSEQVINEADRANGITRRYRVGFSCAASRSWDAKGNRWKEWSPTGYFLFPSGCVVEERQGTLTTIFNEHGRFLPGPGQSIANGAVQQPVRKGEPSLPPGMTRSAE